jgi:hypothetical protein
MTDLITIELRDPFKLNDRVSVISVRYARGGVFLWNVQVQNDQGKVAGTVLDTGKLIFIYRDDLTAEDFPLPEYEVLQEKLHELVQRCQLARVTVEW